MLRGGVLSPESLQDKKVKTSRRSVVNRIVILI
jgi:hypothetical protein